MAFIFMKNLKLSIIILSIVFLIGECVFAQEYDAKTEELLRNLRGIRVKVLKLSRDFKKLAFDEKQIKKEVEDTLIAAGLAIIQNESWQQDPSKASLSVQVVMQKSKVQYFYNVNIYLHIKQMSIMKRGRGERALETNWFRSPLLLIREDKMKDEFLKGLKVLVGDFLNAYLAKNN